MNYDKEKNGKTKGKIVSRDQITEYALQLAEQKQGLKILSLPSNVGKQEKTIHDEMRKRNLPLDMYCIENDDLIYDAFANKLPNDVSYWNASFEESIHHLEKNNVLLDFLWFDACGEFRTFVKQFIEAVQFNLSDEGMAFFTAKVSPRRKGDSYYKLYEYYRMANHPDIEEPTPHDIVNVFKSYLKKRLPDSNLFYELTYKTAKGYTFVVFGISQGDIKVRKRTRHIEKVYEAPKEKRETFSINLEETLAFAKLGVIYTDIAKHYGVNYKTFYHHVRKHIGLKTSSYNCPTVPRISIEEAIEKMKPQPKDEDMNHKIANQVLKLTQQGQTAEQVAQEIGSTKMAVAGVKAAISRGTYGDRKKAELAKAKQRAIIVEMIQSGKTNDQIVAKTGITTSTLGAYKANLNRG